MVHLPNLKAKRSYHVTLPSPFLLSCPAHQLVRHCGVSLVLPERLVASYSSVLKGLAAPLLSYSLMLQGRLFLLSPVFPSSSASSSGHFGDSSSAGQITG